MRNYLLFFAVISLSGIGSSFGQDTALQQFKKLSWLAGTWNRTNAREGRTAGEVWAQERPGYMKGMGYTLVKQDTVFKEVLEIRIRENDLYYVASVPGNGAPVYFKFTALSEDGFVCEQPENDFPKKITYKIKDGILKATISGGGAPVDFIFVKK